MGTRASVILGGLAALALSACGSSSTSSNSTSSAASTSTSSTQSTSADSFAGKPGFEGVAIEAGADLASPGTTQTGKVHGIACGSSEQLFYHIHAHLQVYVNGQPRALPGGIGIPGSQVAASPQGPVATGGQCIYWLHTHAPDGIIHIESPTRRIYTLGEFFDEWHQPLSSTGVAGAQGKVAAYVGGKPWSADVRSIPLLPHAVIQLSVGQPVVSFRRMSWVGVSL